MVKCLPHVVAAWTGWVCPCGHDIADHADRLESYCSKCRCPKAYLGYQRTETPRRQQASPDVDPHTIDVNGVELIEVTL